MMDKLAGKSILATGAASGIGFVTAEQFAREGGIVAATDLNGEGLEQAFAELEVEGLTIETSVQDVTEQRTWALTDEAIKVMQSKGGAIVNDSSIAGLIGEPQLAAYSGTKGGVRTMTKAD